MARSIHNYVLKALAECDLNKVAADVKISPSTLYKIKAGFIPNPGIKSIDVLYFYFLDREGRRLRRKV
jgi:hypothetical protein